MDSEPPRVSRRRGGLSFGLVVGVGLTVVEVFELRWRDAAEFVEEAAVVESVDPFESGEFELVEARPGPALRTSSVS